MNGWKPISGRRQTNAALHTFTLADGRASKFDDNSMNNPLAKSPVYVFWHATYPHTHANTPITQWRWMCAELVYRYIYFLHSPQVIAVQCTDIGHTSHHITGDVLHWTPHAMPVSICSCGTTKLLMYSHNWVHMISISLSWLFLSEFIHACVCTTALVM